MNGQFDVQKTVIIGRSGLPGFCCMKKVLWKFIVLTKENRNSGEYLYLLLKKARQGPGDNVYSTYALCLCECV